MREIPKKNYILLVVVFIMTLLLVIFVRDKYLQKKEFDNQTNKNLSLISEVKEDEIDNYLLENRETIIYMSSTAVSDNENFEKQLKKYIQEEDLNREIVYLNLNEVSNNFYNKLKEKHFAKKLQGIDIEILKKPNMYSISSGKVVAVMYDKSKNINIDDAKRFLKEELK